jgi:trigger factor
MSLKSSNKVDTNRYQLEISLNEDEFEKAVEAAYHKEGKKIVIPGFRKGKAPRKFIEKYYGENVFYDRAINDLYPEALEAAVGEAKLEMIEDKVDFDLVSAGKEGLVFKVTITTKPEVSIEGYKGIAFTHKPVKVTDEDVEAEIKKAQDRNSRMVTVTDREAKSGDIAVIDFEGSVDGVPFEGGKAENHSLTLGAGQFIPGFEEQVVGHKTGEEFDIQVKFPEDYQSKELAGKDSVFAIKLHEIKEKELPAVDDDFVKDVSEFNTLDEYKADVKEKLTKAKEAQSKDEIDNKLIDKLAELLKAEIPQAMFEARIDEDIREFGYRLQSQGLNVENYMKYTGLDKDSFRKQFQEQAERQVKLRLALEAIAAKENIQPSDEDLEKEYAKIAEGYKMETDKVKKMIRNEDLEKDVAVEKAFDLVHDSAVIAEMD